MVGHIKKALRYLKQTEVHQKTLNLQSLTNDELIEEHTRLYQAFLEYYTMGAIGTPLSFVAEIDLKSKGLTDEELNMLTTPKQISYVSQADQFLVTTKNIKGFITKYFWINNNYSGTGVITEGDVKQRLKLLLPKKSVLRKSRAVELKVKLSKIDRRLVELLKHYSVYKDDRKKEILVYLHYIDRILQEVSRRMGLSMEEVRASCPFEFKDVFNGKLTKKELDDRLHYSVIVWERNKKKARILSGLHGKNWEGKTLTKGTHDVKIIKGNTASLGKVTGKVRILLKAGDSNQLKDGEVLVTFMTSPDFMPAISRCSAIVTDLGGVTSHAAIISRELKLPCIVGTKIATKVLRTGDSVEVNANQGIVTILG